MVKGRVDRGHLILEDVSDLCRFQAFVNRIADELKEALSGHLTAERGDVSYTNFASSLGIAESALKKILHRMRARYRWLLRDEVAHTVDNSADIDDEIRHLCSALAAGAEQATAS